MAQLKQKKKKKESGFLTYWRCSYKHTYPHIHPHICSPLQPEKPQPKLLLLPAAGLTVCPSFLMNGHWLPKGTLLLGSAAPSPSLSYPCHHILTISLFSSSIMCTPLHSFLYPLSSPPPLSLSRRRDPPSTPVYSFHRLFICLHKPNLFSLPDAS